MSEPDITYWEYDDDDEPDDIDDSSFFQPTPFPLPRGAAEWFRKWSYRGAHR